jgi:hypothetical protein
MKMRKTRMRRMLERKVKNVPREDRTNPPTLPMSRLLIQLSGSSWVLGRFSQSWASSRSR